MVRLSDPVFKDATVDLPSPPGRDVAALKTYRYLRLGMLAATAALAYSIVEEARKPGVGCFLGSISGSSRPRESSRGSTVPSAS